MVADDLRARVLAAGRATLDAIGITRADPFPDVRATLEQRKAEGLHGGMAFTFRNPARSTDPSTALPGARSLIVGARGYRRSAPDRDVEPRARGDIARYSWEDHYEPLREALEEVSTLLRASGAAARVLVDDNALVDRAAAHRAGIGWYGKNANLLLPGLGSWFVLGSIVTDADLAPTATLPLTTEAGCGPCERCLPACPTGALIAPGVLDARRCLAWLLEAPGVFPREHRVALGGRIYGCDECQDVCPANKLEARRSSPPPAGPRAESWVDLVGMLESSDAELLDRFGRWYIAKRDPAYLRRNALIALANVADGGDKRVAGVLRSALDDPRDVVRAHAVWAAALLDRPDLLEAVAGDASGLVRDELRDLPPPRASLARR